MSFLTAAHLAAGGAGAGQQGQQHGAWGSSPQAMAAGGHPGAWQHAGWQQGRSPGRPLVLLESLSPGRRAVVMAGGVVANVLMAVGFVAWQVGVGGAGWGRSGVGGVWGRGCPGMDFVAWHMETGSGGRSCVWVSIVLLRVRQLGYMVGDITG